MKNISLVIIFVGLVAIIGISCSGETPVSEYKFTTRGGTFENPSIMYQYSMSNDDDWTEFDIESGFSVKNLIAGNYTFYVRGINAAGVVVYAGSKSCFLSHGTGNNITIELYPQFDEQNEGSTLKINLLTRTGDEITANCFVKLCTSGSSNNPSEISLTKCDTGFASTSVSLVPGYYEVCTYVYQNGVEVGGNFDIVPVLTGCDNTFELKITPKSFEGFVDISKNETLTVAKDEVVTLGWVGNGGGEDGNGYWIVGNKVVEDNAMYYTVPTSTAGTVTVEYYRGSIHKTCTVTITDSLKKADAYIMNFRCGTYTSNQACIGYEDKTTHVAFSTERVKVYVGDDYNPLDYSTLNLQPVYGKINEAVFVEVKSDSYININYGQATTENNTTVKKMIVHGNLSTDKIKNRFTALEELIIDGASSLPLGSLSGLPKLKTVYIIPPTDGLTLINKNVFTGSTVEKLVVVGPSSSIKLVTGWASGTDTLTVDDIVYDVKLPL